MAIGASGVPALARGDVASELFASANDPLAALRWTGATATATALAEAAVSLDPLDDSAQELLLRCLVADGRPRLAEAHLGVCEATFAHAGLAVSPALRAAAQDRVTQPSIGLRASVVAESLLQAGTAALDAGAIDGGVETLRRAAADAGRAGNLALEAEVLRALGSALVHAVRGSTERGQWSSIARCWPRARPNGLRWLPTSCANSRSSMSRPGGTSRRPEHWLMPSGRQGTATTRNWKLPFSRSRG